MMRRALLRLANFEPVFMPALSPSMETGTVVEWKKKVGDLVKENEVFCTIQTDKAVVDYTNTFEQGYLAKIYCNNGQSAPVAKAIAVMVSNAADVEKADEFTPEGEEPAAATADETAATPAASTAGGGTFSEAPEGVSCESVFMPALSPSMETGTVVEWKKKVGDLVKENEVFCTIQTDKAVVDYTNTFEQGYLAKIYCNNGQSAPVAKAIAVMVSNAADVEKVANYYPADAVVGTPAAAAASSAAAPAAAMAASPASPAASAKHYGGSIDAAVAASGPSVSRIAAGLEPSALAGVAPSGKGGRFLKSDFAGHPGFDYNDTAPGRATQHQATPASDVSTAATTSASTAAVVGDIYNIVLKAAPVYRSVSDTPLLNKLLWSMDVPKSKAKKVAK